MIKIIVKSCRKCGKEINELTTFRSYLKSNNHICKECDSKIKKISNKKLYDLKKDDSSYKLTKNEKSKNDRKITKEKIITAYGGKCVCCGESNREFLTIDHINGNGHTHRKELGGSVYFYKWLIDNNFPKDNFRLLCMNCNFSVGKYGYCPHKKL